jgi:hypothetical protein
LQTRFLLLLLAWRFSLVYSDRHLSSMYINWSVTPNLKLNLSVYHRDKQIKYFKNQKCAGNNNKNENGMMANTIFLF